MFLSRCSNDIRSYHLWMCFFFSIERDVEKVKAIGKHVEMESDNIESDLWCKS